MEAEAKYESYTQFSVEMILLQENVFIIEVIQGRLGKIFHILLTTNKFF